MRGPRTRCWGSRSPTRGRPRRGRAIDFVLGCESIAPPRREESLDEPTVAPTEMGWRTRHWLRWPNRCAWWCKRNDRGDSVPLSVGFVRGGFCTNLSSIRQMEGDCWLVHDALERDAHLDARHFRPRQVDGSPVVGDLDAVARHFEPDSKRATDREHRYDGGGNATRVRDTSQCGREVVREDECHDASDQKTPQERDDRLVHSHALALIHVGGRFARTHTPEYRLSQAAQRVASRRMGSVTETRTPVRSR